MSEKTNDDVTSQQLSSSYAILKDKYGTNITTSWPNTKFEGEIVDRNDHYAVQQINSPPTTFSGADFIAKHVAHIDTAQKLVKGAKMAVSYNQQGAQVIRSPEEQKTFDKEQYKDFSKGSYAQLKGIAKSEIGSDVKVHVPKPGGQGYIGRVIGLTDIHALQRVGASSAVVHTLNRATIRDGTFKLGSEIQVTYGATLKDRTVVARPERAGKTTTTWREQSRAEGKQEDAYGQKR